MLKKSATTLVLILMFLGGMLLSVQSASAAIAESAATTAPAAAPTKPIALKATITKLLNETSATYPDGTATKTKTFALTLESGEEISITYEQLALSTKIDYQVGDAVLVTKEVGPAGNPIYYITDFVRTPALGLALGLFVLMVIAISGWHGLRSIVGLLSSFVIIFTFILPYLERGYNPVVVAIIGSLFIMLITFYLSHGFHRKTTIAVAGTFISLIATGLLSVFFIAFARLTGFATEEAMFLQVAKGTTFNAPGLLLAGIIIGTLGVLDDITLSQASVVQEIFHANPKLSATQLFLKAMNVGKDHIASLVNTLVLVYTGSSLPLLLMFQDSQLSSFLVLNYEIIAEEIIKTLIGSSGLILAVPITTALAVLYRHSLVNDSSHAGHSHHH